MTTGHEFERGNDMRETEKVKVELEAVKTIKFVGGTILGTLSIVLVPFTQFIPDLPWGMKMFDPTSFPWLIAFFLFGVEAALISATVGAIGITFLGHTHFIGAIMKFSATVPMFLVPAAIIKVLPKINYSSKTLRKPYIWFPLAFFGALTRFVVCFFLNLYWAVPLWTGLTTSEVLETFGGYFNFFLIVVGWNAWQSFWDALLPWLIIYSTKLNENYSYW